MRAKGRWGVVLKKAETCLYCAAPLKTSPDADYICCQNCGRIMEVTRFSKEERRLVEAVDEAKASAAHTAEMLRQCMAAFGEAHEEERQRAEEADRACQQALQDVRSQLELSQARQMRSIYIQAENAQRAGRFEDAEAWYRKLLEFDDGEAEIHWRLVLCRYGVEYVFEQSSGRYLPTICHMVVDSVLENADYQAAMRCAGSDALRAHYLHEAQTIDGILEKYRQIRAMEKPYDVFISVKQGDANGNPTKDSFTAQQLQFELQRRLGLRVFNSRSSLEGHAGTEFEPYIMAALMSAKVMVVVSSRSEYINAPWVRNEWRRFRWLKDNQPGERRLIVFLTGMDVKDVPSAMGDLQAISNTDTEPVKSLIRSVQEIYGGKQSNRDAANLLELASIELEYGEFDKADEYCRKALVLEPRSAIAYALQLCAEKKVRSVEALSQLDQPLDDCVNYQKAVRFADEAFRQALQKWNQDILMRARERIDVSAAQRRAARDALNGMENRRLVDAKQKQEFVEEVDAALRKELSDISADLGEKRQARERVVEFERRVVTNGAEALQLSGEIQQLMQAQDDFRTFSDGERLRARCGDLLAKCTAYLSEATGERQTPKYSADEKRAWSELAELENQKPDTLEKIVELNEKLRLLAKGHEDFKGYSEPSVLNARVYGKLTAVAADGASIADDMLKKMESNSVGAGGKKDRRKQLELIRRFSGDPQLSSKQRAELRRRCDALLAQCDQPEEEKSAKQKPKQPSPQKSNTLIGLNILGILMFIGGVALINWNCVEDGLGVSTNSVIMACEVILILMLAIEKLLCGKRLTQPGEWPGFKLGFTMVLTAWWFIGASSGTDIQRSFSAAPEHNYTTYLVAGALCFHTGLSAAEMFKQKKRWRGCVATIMLVGLVYYLVWFIS